MRCVHHSAGGPLMLARGRCACAGIRLVVDPGQGQGPHHGAPPRQDPPLPIGAPHDSHRSLLAPPSAPRRTARTRPRPVGRGAGSDARAVLLHSRGSLEGPPARPSNHVAQPCVGRCSSGWVHVGHVQRGPGARSWQWRARPVDATMRGSAETADCLHPVVWLIWRSGSGIG